MKTSKYVIEREQEKPKDVTRGGLSNGYHLTQCFGVYWWVGHWSWAYVDVPNVSGF